MKSKKLAAKPSSDARHAKAPVRPEVMAVYYPHWHRYDHGQSWKGEGWTEWEGLKAATARFPGHAQPLKPTWGCFDESDPAWVAKEIDLAVSHGIDTFLYDWYWYSGVRNMEEALERGFLKARNRKKMSFCLMWANHDRIDQFCPEFGKPRNTWLPSRHTPADLERVVAYCSEHYFCQPNYRQVDGRIYFSFFRAAHLVNELGGPAATRRVFDSLDRRLSKDGLPAMHWSGMVHTVEEAALLAEAGFRSTGSYNVNSAGKAGFDCTERYEDVMEAHRMCWERLATGALPYTPVVSMGWDTTPRMRGDCPWPIPPAARAYPYLPVVVGNTPQRFKELLEAARGHLTAEAGGRGSRSASDPKWTATVLLYAWNEWTEGAYLLPEARTGTAYLEKVREVFGMRE